MPTKPIHLTLTGLVCDAFNEPLTGLRVQALQQGLRTQKALASAVTDQEGRYAIKLSRSAAQTKQPLNVLVRVLGKNGKPLAESAVRYKLVANAVIDVKAGGGPVRARNEFDATVEAVTPLLKAGKLKLGALSAEKGDIAHLAGSAGRSAEQVAQLNSAAAWAKEAGLDAQVIYALLRAGAPHTRDGWSQWPAEHARRALEQAIAKGTISARHGQDLDAVMRAYDAASVRAALRAKSPSVRVLESVLKPAEQQAFLETLVAHEQKSEKFWEALAQRPAFRNKKLLARTKDALEVFANLYGQAELTTYLLKPQGRRAGISSPSELVKLSTADWLAAIRKAGVREFPEGFAGSPEPEQRFAESLSASHARLYPGAHFGHRMATDRDSSIGRTPGLKAFFAANPGFDLHTKDLRTALAAADFSGLNEDTRKAVEGEVRCIHRLYRLTPDYAAVNALHKEGIRSASGLVREYGEQEFVQAFGERIGGAQTAQTLYQNAASVSNKGLAWAVAAKASQDVHLQVMESAAAAEYHEMFGDGSSCACEHCQSVYSPSAYFVDLLAFIKEHSAEAFDKLTERRPDLEYILLTCANTNTVLPYIDLVNEILQREVVRIATLAAGEEYDGASSFQTESESAMLLTRPEHAITDALDKLTSRDASIAQVYALPFSPYLDEVRAYAEKAGTSRLELLEALYTSDADEARIAVEHLGLDDATIDAIVKEGSWPVTSSEAVNAILEALAISYEELLRLLALEHLNPAATDGARALQVSDVLVNAETGERTVTCDLSLMSVPGMSTAWLQHAARTIRLWKKLNWDLFDLDRCIMGLGLEFGTDITSCVQGLVIPLHRVERIAERMKLTVREALAMLVDMETGDRHDAGSETVVPSHYRAVFRSTALGAAAFPENANELNGQVYAHQPAICAALNISDADFHRLQPSDVALSTASLSTLWRKVKLMRHLRMDASTFVASLELLENKSEASGLWAGKALTLALDEVDLLRATGADIERFHVRMKEKIGVNEAMLANTEMENTKLALAPRLLLDLRFTKDEVLWLHDHRTSLGLEVAFRAFGELVTNTPEPGLYGAFVRIQHVKKCKEALGGEWRAPFDLARSGGTKEAWLNAVQASSTLASDHLQMLCGATTTEAGMLGFAYPADALDAERVMHALATAAHVQKLGCSALQLTAITAPEESALPMHERVELVKALARAKHSEASWPDAERAAQDRLRKRRRDALVAWVLANNNEENKWRTTNDLHAALLIDVEMSSCMLTSRTKQAISSVQLFVDRCLMGLEPVSLNKDFADQWNRWRKQYRVWEANRKVFLYPENWIEPELRKDKSPFFQELENESLQGDISDERAEKALFAYLEKLDAVANLEITALHQEPGGSKRLHVVGRTRNHPHRYFYRYRENKVWSAWEKMDLDIEGDHMLITVWNGRLLLFWGQFTDKQYEGGPTTIKGSNGDMKLESPKAKTYVEMKLVWSEYSDGKWGGKKMAKEVCEIKGVSELPVPQGEEPWLATDSSKEVFRDSIMLAVDASAEWLLIRVLQKDSDFPTRLHHAELFQFDNCNGEPRKIRIRIASYVHAVSEPRNNAIELEEANILALYDRSPFSKTIPAPRRILLDRLQRDSSISPMRQSVASKGRMPHYQQNSSSSYLVESSSVFDTMGEHQLDWDGMDTQVAVYREVEQPVSREGGARSIHSGTEEARLPSETAISRVDGVMMMNGLSNGAPLAFKQPKFTYTNHFHPYTCQYLDTLRRSGLDGLYAPGLQELAVDDFGSTFLPTSVVATPYPVKNVDFSPQGAYALYNWELFFHIPLLIAKRLQADRKFAEARRWYHRIFDPTRLAEGEGAKRFWITKPFRDEIDGSLLNLEELLLDSQHVAEMNAQLDVWERNPFDPHALARLRTSAYMRTTVIGYIENLIAWGDELFRRDTIESINEATLLYVLAANILGEKQPTVPQTKEPVANSFSTVSASLDAFSNFLAKVEDHLEPSKEGADPIRMPGFCLPSNQELLRCWDTVADRLFKVRHCMNIAGVVRQPPLFEPPIDPGLLVRATASGLSLDQILSSEEVALPHYRFRTMLQRANELCAEVRGLGSHLLSTLEKKDAEELALLRSTQEQNMLRLIRSIKVKSRDEAKEQLKAAQAARKVVEKREEYYLTREYRNAAEEKYFWAMQSTLGLQALLDSYALLRSVVSILPEFKIGSGFTIGSTFGGQNLTEAAKGTQDKIQVAAGILRTSAEMTNMKATYQRRDEDWKFQAASATLELAQSDKQILAAEIRLAIAEKDLENHDVQMEHAKAVDDYMRSKFTNQELYQWMASKLSATYFQTYELALKAAKQAAACLKHELGEVEMSVTIGADHWDGLKKGLLSGEKLQLDLRRLETEYTAKDEREFELTKHISLAQLDPFALITLRETGTCKFEIPEVLYDLDFPGHYFRRIRSVSISLPCVAGPYTSVSATLKQTDSRYRKNAEVEGGYAERVNESATTETDRFVRSGWRTDQAIATSHGQNDAGVFELNFRDERYLPFEGTGAVGKWKLELPPVPQFNYDTISDVVVHIRYTAKPGDTLKDPAKTNVETALARLAASLGSSGAAIAIDLKRDMPNEWHRLRSTGAVELSISKDRLPYMAASLPNTSISEVHFLLRGLEGTAGITLRVGGDREIVGQQASDVPNWRYDTSRKIALDAPFGLELPAGAALEHLVLLVRYAFKPDA